VNAGGRIDFSIFGRAIAEFEFTLIFATLTSIASRAANIMR